MTSSIDPGDGRMHELGDQLEKMAEKHEATNHDGEVCASERVNMIAYIAYRLGMDPPPKSEEEEHEGFLDMLDCFVDRVRDYVAVHEEHAP